MVLAKACRALGMLVISVLVELEEVKLRMGPLPCLRSVSKPRPETLAARRFKRSA